MKEHENKKHVNEIMHEGKIIFTCDKCKFLCNKKEVLLTHSESHDIFACTKCEFVSTTKNKLKTHLKNIKMEKQGEPLLKLYKLLQKIILPRPQEIIKEAYKAQKKLKARNPKGLLLKHNDYI